jgi:hypothetical protein
VEYPKDLEERLSIVCMAVDQQKSELAGHKYFVCVVRGWCENGDSYLLSAGTDNSLAAVEERLNAVYFNHRVSLCLCDNGGFNNEDDLDILVRDHPQVIYYKGTNAKYLDNKNFKPSTEIKKLFLFDALKYQVKLLDLLYSPKRITGYNFNLPLQVDDQYFRELCNVKPNTRMGKDGNGEEFSNWAAFNNDRRDYFDAEKMCLACLDLSVAILPPSAFKHGHVPTFIAKEKIMEIARLRRKMQ